MTNKEDSNKPTLDLYLFGNIATSRKTCFKFFEGWSPAFSSTTKSRDFIFGGIEHKHTLSIHLGLEY